MQVAGIPETGWDEHDKRETKNRLREKGIPASRFLIEPIDFFQPEERACSGSLKNFQIHVRNNNV